MQLFSNTKEVKADTYEEGISGKQHWSVLTYPKNAICCFTLNGHISVIVFMSIKNKLFSLLSESKLTKGSKM